MSDAYVLVPYLIAAAVFTVTPGPDTAVVLRSATADGRRSGVGAAMGVCGGLVLWSGAAALGLTALLAASELAYSILKWAGAAYLCYLGAQLIRSPGKTPDARPASPGSAASSLRRGFLTNILNPKVGIYYVTFLPQFIPPGADIAATSLLLAGVHILMTATWYALLVSLVSPLGRMLAAPKVARNLDRITGSVFVGFGLKLVFSHRT